jgi:hypothetical protein
MTAEKASTLRLLRDGMGQAVRLVEDRSELGRHEVRALLPELSSSEMIPVLFLITSLAFLEAENSQPDPEQDGWTPADFLFYLRLDQGGYRVALDEIRERQVFTEVSLDIAGNLKISTIGRGQSASRWLKYVEGRTHLQTVRD